MTTVTQRWERYVADMDEENFEGVPNPVREALLLGMRTAYFTAVHDTISIFVEEGLKGLMRAKADTNKVLQEIEEEIEGLNQPN